MPYGPMVFKKNKGSGVLGGSLIRLHIETELPYLEWTMCGDCANLGVLARGGGRGGGLFTYDGGV